MALDIKLADGSTFKPDIASEPAPVISGPPKTRTLHIIADEIEAAKERRTEARQRALDANLEADDLDKHIGALNAEVRNFGRKPRKAKA